MKTPFHLLLPALLASLLSTFAFAQTPPAPELTDAQMTEGIRSGFTLITTQALTPGSLKVPAPKLFIEAEAVLTKANKTDTAKRFNTALNDTVTRLTPKVGEALRAVLKDMKIEDPQTVLAGSPKSGTQYLQKTIQSALRDAVLPLVRKEITAANLATSAKAMIDAAFPAGAKGATSAIGNLDYHIRDRMIADAFKLIGDREAAVKANPTLLTGNALAQKVFASAKK